MSPITLVEINCSHLCHFMAFALKLGYLPWSSYIKESYEFILFFSLDGELLAVRELCVVSLGIPAGA